MMSYLVTSETRRRLLKALWAEGRSGSVHALAADAEVSFTAAHRELALMEESGLAISERNGAAHLYRANRASPHAALLRRLLLAEESTPPASGDEELRGRLRSLGAPLLVKPRPLPRGTSIEATLARGLSLSHHDATLARVMPVLLAVQWENLDHSRLSREAHRVGEKQALGFFADLTGLLRGDAGMRAWAATLRDKRVRKTRDYFGPPRGRFERALVEKNTPELAWQWHYRMNLPLESFRAALGKFVNA